LPSPYFAAAHASSDGGLESLKTRWIQGMQPEQGDGGSFQLSELSRTMRTGLFRRAV
jgi:hypothetical protein